MAAAELHRSRRPPHAAPAGGRTRHPADRPRWRRWLTWRRTALLLAVDLVVGVVAWHAFFAGSVGGAEGAVVRIVSAAGQRNWPAVYDQLCSLDRQRYPESEVAQDGDALLLRLGGLTGTRDLTVTRTGIPVGPFHWPAARVSGELTPAFGQPTPFTVTVVRDITSWRVCTSVGGYSAPGLGIDVPLTTGP